MDEGISVLNRIIKAANIRQKVIASNIANADTPGYKAKDVRFSNFLKNEMKLMTTHPGHMSTHKGEAVNGTVVTDNRLSWADGNNVELSAEVAKMTQNSLRHDAAIKILNSKIKMYKNAIRSAGR